MESRNAYGCSIDLPAEGKLPTVDQLVGIVKAAASTRWLGGMSACWLCGWFLLGSPWLGMLP